MSQSTPKFKNIKIVFFLMFFSYCFELSPILYNRERNRNAYSLQLINHIYTRFGQGKPRFTEFARSPMPKSSSRGWSASLPCGFIVSLHKMQEPFTNL